MSKKNSGFFSRMRRSDNPGFEISMFAISIAIAIAVLAGIVVVGLYWAKGQANRYTDEEVNANTVTETAVEVDKDEEPVQTIDPEGDMIINEDNVFAGDEDLKTAEYAYTTSAVNLRAEPSLTAAVLLKVPSGEQVRMVSYDGNEWAKVSYQAQEGYINAMYLSVTKPVPLPTVAPQVTPKVTVTPTPEPTPTPEETVAPDETAEPDYPEETEEPKPTKTPKPTKEPEPTEEPIAPTDPPTEEPPEEPVVDE